jgi:hypothetical protein
MLIETSDGFQTIASRKATGITPWIATTCNVIECLGVGIEPRIEKAQQGFPGTDKFITSGKPRLDGELVDTGAKTV